MAIRKYLKKDLYIIDATEHEILEYSEASYDESGGDQDDYEEFPDHESNDLVNFLWSRPSDDPTIIDLLRLHIQMDFSSQWPLINRNLHCLLVAVDVRLSTPVIADMRALARSLITAKGGGDLDHETKLRWNC